ncbi:MAG: thiamine-phosphate kinase [Acidobacteriota bacterium]
MEIKEITEKALIKEIQKEFLASKPGLLLGIGDDAAVVKADKKSLILTKDLLLEETHFYKDEYPAFFLGRKSLNVSLSDIAAMGGRPLYALLGLGLPEKTATKWAEEFMMGIKSACEEFDVVLTGGDISQAKLITISVTVIGEGKHIIKRSGAQPGDFIYVSGKLGDSAQGLQLLKQGARLGEDKRKDVLLNAFLDPVPQVPLGRTISENRIASSMIDVSDGLSVDLNHICEESRVGAEVFAEQIPFSKELEFFQDDVTNICLHGGEDYSLLFTVPEKRKKHVDSLKKQHEVSEIGKITESKGLFLIHKDGRKEQLDIKGYQHFFK